MKDQLVHIRDMISRKNFGDAIDACNAYLETAEIDRHLILRERSKAFSIMGDHAQALKDRRLLISEGTADLSDHFEAGFDALHYELYAEAESMFRDVLNMGKLQQQDWFETPALFYLIYATIRQGKLEEAKQLMEQLASIDRDIALQIPGVRICHINELNQELTDSLEGLKQNNKLPIDLSNRALITDEKIDAALLSNMSHQWRKVARVVGTTMSNIPRELRMERDDIYFANRIKSLVERALIEASGDPIEMGITEIRLLQLNDSK